MHFKFRDSKKYVCVYVCVCIYQRCGWVCRPMHHTNWEPCLILNAEVIRRNNHRCLAATCRSCGGTDADSERWRLLNFYSSFLSIVFWFPLSLLSIQSTHILASACNFIQSIISKAFSWSTNYWTTCPCRRLISFLSQHSQSVAQVPYLQGVQGTRFHNLGFTGT